MSNNDRCYGEGGELVNQPNPLDAQNPFEVTPYEPIPLSTESANVVSDAPPLPGGRCYGADPDDELTNEPNPLEAQYPVRPVAYTPPPQEEELDPRAVVRALVDRCYPDRAPISFEEDDVPEIPSGVIPGDPLDFMCNLFPDLPFCKSCQGPQCFPHPYEVQFKIPLEPDFPTVGGNDDCAEVERLITEGIGENLGEGYWRNTITDVQYYCPDREGNTDWERCVKNTLDCMFAPYKDGAWKPPAQDCMTFYPQGYNGNVTEICIANCFPERQPIYEYKIGGAPVLAFEPYGDGIHDAMAVTSDADGTWDGTKMENEGGNKYWSSGGTRTQTFSFGSATVTVKAQPINDDGEWDTDFWTYWTGTLPAIGTEQSFSFTADRGNITIVLSVLDGADNNTDNSYGKSPTAPAGYVRVSDEPAFYLHKEATANSIPLYKFYSSDWVDTFLTTNPGQPDGPGRGERDTMNNGNMGFVEILGYAYDDAPKMVPFLADGERAELLHRYWKGNGGTHKNHKYSIDAQTYQKPPTKEGGKNYYHIPGDIHDALLIKCVLERGGAGYQNALGVYIARPGGDPVWGMIIEPQATTSTGMKKVRVKPNILKQYKNHELGFFLIPNGGNLNSLSNGQIVSFSSLSDGWRTTGVSSAQSNYTFFSDERLNPADSSREDSRQYTKWVGDNYQYWEDLIGGDNDFDDMKFYHELLWQGSAYRYEGVQCHVWRNDRPAPVTVPIRQKGACDERLFDTVFSDVQLTRSGCGPEVYSVDPDATEMKIECGKCDGPYTFEANRTQTLTVISAGRFSLRSMGGITGGIAGDCIVARFRLRINGVQVWNQRITMSEWPEIGFKMHTGIDGFDVNPGDEVELRLMSIRQGPFAGGVTPKMAVFDENLQLFEGTINIRLMTTAGDGQSYPIPYQSGNKDTVPATGQIQGLKFKMGHRSGEDSRNNGNIRWDLTDFYTMYSNSSIYDTDANYSSQLTWSQRMFGQSRGWDYTTGSKYGAYIDSYGIDSGDRKTHFNKLVSQDLFKDGKTGPHVANPSGISGDTINHMKSTHHYARLGRYSDQATLWWDQSASKYGSNTTDSEILTDLYDGIGQSNVFENYEPGYFIQDYYLVDPDQKDPISYNLTAKIRVGITFYPYSSGPGNTNFGRGRRRTNFYAIVELLQVLNPGFGYEDGQEFTLKWPLDFEKKEKKWAGQSTEAQIVDSTFSPFHPKYNKPNTYGSASYDVPAEIGIPYEYQDRSTGRGRSPVRNAIYQESHNKQSMIWYLRRSDPKNHIHFKVRVSDVS